MEAEKQLGIKSKKEIEKLGIEKFIEQCKKSVFIYKKDEQVCPSFIIFLDYFFIKPYSH